MIDSQMRLMVSIMKTRIDFETKPIEVKFFLISPRERSVRKVSGYVYRQEGAVCPAARIGKDRG